MKLINLFLILCYFLISITLNGCLDSDKEHIIVSTLNNKLRYDKGDLIEFKINLVKGDKPVVGASIMVYDNLSLICTYTSKTNNDGETTYRITAKSGGQYSFLFFHNDIKTSSNFAIYINEKHTDNNFKSVVTKLEELPPLGENVETTQETFSQKSLDVTMNTLTESASNPIFLSTGALCILGAGASLTGIGATVGAPIAAFSCPAAFDAFMGSLLINVTRNSIKKFETNEKKKEELLNIVNTADLMQSIVSIDDVILQSPKGGKNILSYRWDTPQGSNAGSKALQRITEVSNIIIGVSQIENPEIKMIKKNNQINGFVCSYFIQDKSLNENLLSIETKRMVTLGFVTKKSMGCNANELLNKSNLNVISDKTASFDLFNKTFKYSYSGETKKIKINYDNYSGSFLNNGSDECLILITAVGDFCMAEGPVKQVSLIFNKDEKFLKQYEIEHNWNKTIDKVLDIDSDGLSEIIFLGFGRGAGVGWYEFEIAYGDLKNIIFHRPFSHSSGGSNPFLPVDYESKYKIEGDKLLFDLEVYFFDKNKKSYEPVKTEKYYDEFQVKNGKVKHIKGNMENFEEYLKNINK
jgi:hypothetical protein